MSILSCDTPLCISEAHIPGNSMKTVMCTTRQKDKSGKYCAVVQALQGNQGYNKKPNFWIHCFHYWNVKFNIS
jgi:hypothetical protein